MRISRLCSTLPVLLSMSLLSWTFLSAHAQHKADKQEEEIEKQSFSEPGAWHWVSGEESRSSENQDPERKRPGQPRASTDDSVPSGLVVVIENKPQKDRALDLRALNNPFISGVALQIHWRDLEPVQGKPDWSKLDELFAAAESSKKWVQLLIFPGFFAPPWALEGVKTEQFAIQYGPGKGTVLRLPMPWDSVYLNRWFAFLKQLSDRYRKSPAFKMIGAAGPTSVSVEMTLPRDVKKWKNDSYSPSKYIGAYQKVFQVYAAGFPNQWVSLSMGNALNINDQGKIAPREGMRTRQTIIDQAISLLGRRFVLQNSDLHAGPDQQPATSFVMSYSGRIITGLQLKCAAELGTCSAAMGAQGDPPLALRRSIDKGMEPNSAGQHVNYLEIHESDVLADEMQPVLRYAASLFAREQHSERFPGGGHGVPGEESRSSESQDSEAKRPGFRGNIKQPDQERASGKINMPHGISAVNPIDANRAGKLFDTSNPTLNAYTNPNTSGVTFRTSWADVEPEDGKFAFSKIDTVFASAEKNGKWVELILIPGFGTPSWAMRGVQSGMFTIPYGPGNGMLLPLPVPWDQTYLSRWFTFLKVIGDRYGGKASFRKIAAAGPTCVSAEMSLPDSPNDIVQWEKLGYTTQKYINAWKQTFGVYSSIFPHQYFSLALHLGLPIPDRRQKAYVREQIVSLGLQYPSQFALQADGLNSGRANETYGDRVVIEHSGQVVTGFMMSTSATLRSQHMGDEGDPPLALRKSIDKGMELNKAGHHVNYLEIYEPDVLADEMQPVLRYGASLFERKQH
jgi:hypothetical protein